MSYGPDVQELGKGEGKSMEWFNRIELGRYEDSNGEAGRSCWVAI